MTRRIPTRPRSRRAGGSRVVMALVMAVVAMFSYYSSKTYNPVTNEEQYIGITPDQEIALGLQSVEPMTQQYGGLYPDPEIQQFIDDVCDQLIFSSAAGETEWPFECNLLADESTVNAFALPGGQMFMTLALYNRLDTEGQVAGVMAHEIGHVVARHSAQQIAKTQLTQGLSGAAVMAAYDPNDPRSAGTAQVVALIGQTINMKFGRDDELQSDRLGVQFMSAAGYDPRSLIGVMQILAEVGGGSRQPEFMSTHPNPENRIERIELVIEEVFPNGVPEGLIP